MGDIDVRTLFRGSPEEVLSGLHDYQLLPRMDDGDLKPADVRPMDRRSGPVVRLDAQHPHVGNSGMYASFPSGLHTMFDPPELLIWGTGNNLAYLILYFQGLAAGSYMAAISVQVWNNSTVKITATNSAGLTVSSGSTSTPVTFQIPFQPNGDGLAVVSMTPGTTSQGFSWFGTEVRIA